MININIDPSRIFAYITLILLAYSLIQSIRYFIKASKRDRAVSEWFKDDRKIKLYNLYIRYVETDITTGLRKSMDNIEFPTISNEDDYQRLKDMDKLLVQAVIMYIITNYTDLSGLEKHIEDYLEAAEIIKQSKGF